MLPSLPGLAARLRALLLPAAVARELEEELRYHLDAETERRVARGLTRREAELAARRAVGNLTLHREAAREGVLRLVLADGLRLVGAGVALGVVAAAGATRLVASRRYGIGPGDPVTIGGIAALLAAVAAMATWLPARRAANADPTVALRTDRVHSSFPRRRESRLGSVIVLRLDPRRSLPPRRRGRG